MRSICFTKDKGGAREGYGRLLNIAVINSHLESSIQCSEQHVCSSESRGVYSKKFDCLVLPKNLAFYGKPAKTFMRLDSKVAETL